LGTTVTDGMMTGTHGDVPCELPRLPGRRRHVRETKGSRMEHICLGCGYKEVNINATRPSTCERCGEQMLHSWDKPSDYKREMMREEDDD
jgi:DNA-directed RNA polymerase subunit RPC12/RpoP